MGGDNKDGNKVDSPRNFGGSRRIGDSSSHSKTNPFNAISPLTTNSPSAGASSAFGLGSGAFASFGSAKTPKTPGAGGDFDLNGRDKGEKDTGGESASEKSNAKPSTSTSNTTNSASPDHPLRSTWTLFYRPPTSKYSDYEKSTIKLASISTVGNFWTIYSHLKRPSQLPSVSDYHIFKEGIRPVWEDESNKRGGKWIVRLKKGVADRYWEDLLFAIVGDQFMEAGEEVCGAVLSVRSGEDVLNVWTKNDGGRNVKIRLVDLFLGIAGGTNVPQRDDQAPPRFSR
jgi:translation initiation factor 4E